MSPLYFSLTLGQTTAPPPTPAPAPAPASGLAAPGQPLTSVPPAGDSAATTTKTEQSPFGGIWPMLLMLAIFFYIVVLMPQRKEKRKREELMAAMKKGQKAQTIGGVIGTIVDIRDNEIVLRVDDHNNTRIRYIKSAILSVTSEGDEKAAG